MVNLVLYSLILATVAHGAVILESSCDMSVTLDASGSTFSKLTLQHAAQFEEESSMYLNDLLRVYAGQDLTNEDQPIEEPPITNMDWKAILKVGVSAKQDSTIKEDASSTMRVAARVSVIYDSTKALPVHLDEVLNELVASTTARTLIGLPVVSFVFGGIEDDSRVLFYTNARNTGGKADTSLIAATAILSAVLLLVSSLLLLVTGGWDALKRAVTNCLFEEVYEDDDDDQSHYLARSKPSFQVTTTEEDDEYTADGGPDEESAMTGMQTNPSGMLGGRPLAEGIGIGYQTDGDDTTQFTADGNSMMSPALQLGIGNGLPFHHHHPHQVFPPQQQSQPPMAAYQMQQQRTNSHDGKDGVKNGAPASSGGLAQMILQRMEK